MHIPHLGYIGFLIYPVWGILYFAYTPFFSLKNIPRFRLLFYMHLYFILKKIYTPFEVNLYKKKKKYTFGYIFKKEKNIPQTGYKRKIKYTPNGVYFFVYR